MEALKAVTEIDGAELVRRARAGDGAAWEDIVSSFSRRIFNLAYRFTSNIDAAEDLTQDVFIRVYRSLEQYDAKQGDLANWLMRLARNLIIDDYRHRQRNPQNTMADAVDDHQYHLRAAGTSASAATTITLMSHCSALYTLLINASQYCGWPPKGLHDPAHR